jgi:hypothetical protein
MASEGLSKLMDDLKLACSVQGGSLDEGRHIERVSEKRHVFVEMDDSDDGDGNNKSGDEDGQEFNEEDEGEDDDILENDIQPPEYRKGRGRPKSKRYVSKGESASVKKTKASAKTSQDATGVPQIRYCKTCGRTGHNSATCGRESSYKRKK